MEGFGACFPDLVDPCRGRPKWLRCFALNILRANQDKGSTRGEMRLPWGVNPIFTLPRQICRSPRGDSGRRVRCNGNMPCR